MAEPIATTKHVKDWLRIETNREDALLEDLIKQAIGEIETSVGKSLSTESVVWYDNGQSERLYGSPRALLLRYTPIDASSVVVTDGLGVVVDAANYVVRQDLGQILGLGGVTPTWDGAFIFSAGTYAIACTAGYGTSPTYETRELPMIRRIVVELVAFWYQQRTVGASSEGSAGARVSYDVDDATGYPKRVARALRKLRGIVVATV